MMRLKAMVAIFGFFVLISCKKDETKIPLATQKTKEKYSQIKELGWLLGNWENEQQNGLLKLSWKKENDSSFIGNSYVFRENDTLKSESMMLIQSGDSLRFIIREGTGIVNNNQDKQILLTLKSFTRNKYIFESSENQFPKKVSYHKFSEDTLVSETSGLKDGKQSIEEFKLVKMK